MPSLVSGLLCDLLWLAKCGGSDAVWLLRLDLEGCCSFVFPLLKHCCLVNKHGLASLRTRDCTGSFSCPSGSSRRVSGNTGTMAIPLQSCLENSMHKWAWWATIHGLLKTDMTEHAHAHAVPASYQLRCQLTAASRSPCLRPGETLPSWSQSKVQNFEQINGVLFEVPTFWNDLLWSKG